MKIVSATSHIGSPPLVEVAHRFSVNPPLVLEFDFYAHLKKELGDGYKVEQLQRLEQAPGLPEIFIPIPPTLPGQLFKNSRTGISITVHPQLIGVRWKREAREQEEYPEFDAMFRLSKKVIGSVRDWFKGEFECTVVSLVYVSLVESGKNPAFLLSKDHYAESLQSASHVQDYQFGRKLDDGIDLRLHLQEASWRSPEKLSEGYRFSTAAGLKLETEDSLRAITRVHDALHSFFCGMLAEDYRKAWCK